MYIFNAISQKMQLSLSEFKRLYLHSRLPHLAPFFQNFLGGGPPNPHQREGTPLPYPPHSALRASRKPPPRLTSGSATDTINKNIHFINLLHLIASAFLNLESGKRGAGAGAGDLFYTSPHRASAAKYPDFGCLVLKLDRHFSFRRRLFRNFWTYWMLLL